MGTKSEATGVAAEIGVIMQAHDPLGRLRRAEEAVCKKGLT